jgi:cytochrome c556
VFELFVIRFGLVVFFSVKEMGMKRFLMAAALAAAMLAPAAQAQMKPEDAIKHRKAAFNVIAYNFGNIGAMVNGRKPYNKAEAEKNAMTASTVAWQPYEFFGAGTDKGETRAKPNVWTDMAKFKAGGEKMQAEFAKLVTAAKADEAALKAQFAEVGKSCKACHDEYRKE